MRKLRCGCSLQLSALLFLWMEAIFFGFLLLELLLMETGSYGSFIHTSLITTFGMLAIIRFTAIYGIYIKNRSCLIPQMACQILEIILIVFLIFLCIAGFSFMKDFFDFIINGSKIFLPFKEFSTAIIGFLRYIVGVSISVILVVECCFMKILHDLYLSLIPKNPTSEEFVTVTIGGLTGPLYNLPKQQVTSDDIQMVPMETLI